MESLKNTTPYPCLIPTWMANLASAYFPANPNLVMDCHTGPTADFSSERPNYSVRVGSSAEWLLRRDLLIIPNRIKSYRYYLVRYDSVKSWFGRSLDFSILIWMSQRCFFKVLESSDHVESENISLILISYRPREKSGFQSPEKKLQIRTSLVSSFGQITSAFPIVH